MVMLGHRSLNVIRWEATTTAVSIARNRVPVERVARLVLLGTADLIEDVCVDMLG